MTIQTITRLVKVVVGTFAIRTAGTHGNNLLVSTCPSATAYEEISKLHNKSINNKSVGNTTINVD